MYKKHFIIVMAIIVLALPSIRIFDNFVHGMGITSRNAKWCFVVFNTENRRYCLDKVYNLNAREKKDPSFCDKITFATIERRDCYFSVAKAFGDPNICDSFSGLLGEQGRDACKKDALGTVAVNEKDPTICAKLSSNYWKANCYSRVGIAMSDAGLCNLAGKLDPDGISKSECLKGITDIGAGLPR